MYAVGDVDVAMKYFQEASLGGHPEAKFACGLLLYFEKHETLSEVSHYFEDASRDGVWLAQYFYGNELVSRSDNHESRKMGAQFLAMAAKDILLRFRYERVKTDIMKDVEFFYKPIPEAPISPLRCK